jgi:FdhD protein
MKSLHEALIIRVKGDDIEEMTDQVASEIGFTLNVNEKQVVTLLCTPSELDAMAIGFLLSEGILKNRQSLLDLQVDEGTRSGYNLHRCVQLEKTACKQVTHQDFLRRD